MINRNKRAQELFNKQYNCAQAIFLAYADLFELDEKTALKMTAGFGGGIASMGEVCGAINAAVMVLGLKYGSTDISNIEKKNQTKSIIRDFINDFKKEHKSIYCRDLLTEDKPNIHKMHSKKCNNLVEQVCKILDRYI